MLRIGLCRNDSLCVLLFASVARRRRWICQQPRRIVKTSKRAPRAIPTIAPAGIWILSGLLLGRLKLDSRGESGWVAIIGVYGALVTTGGGVGENGAGIFVVRGI